MKRFFSALIILIIVLIVFIFGNTLIVDIFTSLTALLCIYELFHAFEQKGHHPVYWIGYVAAASISFIHLMPKEHILVLIGAIISITILVSFILVITKKTKTNVLDIAITFFGVCYIVLFLMFVPLIRGMENGIFLIWYIFITSWMTDIFAYETGRAIGKHHFTEVSPNKTIEGCIGGAVGSVVCMIAYTLILNQFFGFNINCLIILIVGIILSIIGQIGDLSASAIKRYSGIKDYGDLIPGHGGMMDRIDSMIFIAPFAYLLFTII